MMSSWEMVPPAAATVRPWRSEEVMWCLRDDWEMCERLERLVYQSHSDTLSKVFRVPTFEREQL